MSGLGELNRRADFLESFLLGNKELETDEIIKEDGVVFNLNREICSLTNKLASFDSTCPGFSYVAEEAQQIHFPSTQTDILSFPDGKGFEECEPRLDKALIRTILLNSSNHLEVLEQKLKEIENGKDVIEQPLLSSERIDKIEAVHSSQAKEIYQFHDELKEFVEVYSTAMEAVSFKLIEWEKELSA